MPRIDNAARSAAGTAPAAPARRAPKAAARVRRTPAARPGGLRDLVEQHRPLTPARASRRTRSGRCCPGPLAWSPMPWTRWPASALRSWPIAS